MTPHVFVGGYEIDPSNPSTCQICGRHYDKHEGAAEAPAETRGEELTSGSALVSADRTTVTWINQHGHTVTVQVHEPAPEPERS